MMFRCLNISCGFFRFNFNSFHKSLQEWLFCEKNQIKKYILASKVAFGCFRISIADFRGDRDAGAAGGPDDIDLDNLADAVFAGGVGGDEGG